MELETKFFRLRTPVVLGSRFDHWRVCWLGGWAKHRLYYLVMLVKVARCEEKQEERIAAGQRDRRR